jgi:two-component system phosphate regulon response regulator PhoB
MELRKLVLVIDEDAAVREFVKLHLNQAGYHVVPVGDVITAGHAMLRSMPDLVIVDAHMPYLSGLELISTLIADQTLPPCPAILMSRRGEIVERALAVGADFLRKPFSAKQLLELVRSHLEEPPAELWGNGVNA